MKNPEVTFRGWKNFCATGRIIKPSSLDLKGLSFMVVMERLANEFFNGVILFVR